MCSYNINDILPTLSTTRYVYTTEEFRQIGNDAQQNTRHKLEE